MNADMCVACLHPLAEHVLATEQCRHPAGQDAYCCCAGYEAASS